MRRNRNTMDKRKWYGSSALRRKTEYFVQVIFYKYLGFACDELICGSKQGKADKCYIFMNWLSCELGVASTFSRSVLFLWFLSQQCQSADLINQWNVGSPLQLQVGSGERHWFMKWFYGYVLAAILWLGRHWTTIYGYTSLWSQHRFVR